MSEQVDVTVQLSGTIVGPLAVLQGHLQAWFAETWAPEWYADAVLQADLPNNHGARRREIVFAQAMIESYLVEWVRDDVRVGFGRLGEFFRANDRTPIIQRWKRVIKQLREEGAIPASPDFGNAQWRELAKLVEQRNWLLHARSSRPGTAKQPPDERPLPTKGELLDMRAGWAVAVATAVIRDLHEALGTPAPPWLQ